MLPTRVPGSWQRTQTVEPGARATPDRLVFDLDAGAPATIVECCRVAEALRAVLIADVLDRIAANGDLFDAVLGEAAAVPHTSVDQ